MDDALITDDQKTVMLETCERRIISAFRRGIEATSDIGKELIAIEKDKLYEAIGFESLSTYAEHRLLLDNSAVNRFINVFQTVTRLELAGVKQLPSNESQVLQLAKLPPERIVEVWSGLVEHFDDKEEGITVSDVRQAVDKDKERAGGDKPKPGVKTQIKIDEPLSESGERALAKIKRVCGDDVAGAIKSGTRQLSEQAIIKWAEQNESRMKDLVYYVIDQAWTVKQALDYEDRQISGESTLDELTLRARARSGLRIEHEEFMVTFAHRE